MPRLVPNPVADVTQPLLRMEKSLATVVELLADVRSLPHIHAELERLQATTREMQQTLAELVADERAPAASLRGARAARGSR